MNEAVQAILTILILFASGAFLYKLGWVNDHVMAFIAKFVVKFSVPCMMVWNLTNMFTRAELMDMLPLVPVPLLMSIVLYGLSWTLAVLFRVKKERRGTFTLMAVVSNTLFIGYPVSLMVFGEASVPAVTLSFLASTIVCWTFGVSGLEHDARCTAAVVKRYSLGHKVLQVVSTPPMVALVVGIVLAVSGIALPSAINNALSYIGSVTTPLSMLYIGMFLATMSLKDMVPGRDAWLVFFCRFLLAPVLMFAFIWIGRQFGLVVDTLSSNVLVIQMGMPVMTQSVILAKDFGGDATFAAKTTASSNLVFLVMFPLTLLALGAL